MSQLLEKLLTSEVTPIDEKTSHLQDIMKKAFMTTKEPTVESVVDPLSSSINSPKELQSVEPLTQAQVEMAQLKKYTPDEFRRRLNGEAITEKLSDKKNWQSQKQYNDLWDKEVASSKAIYGHQADLGNADSEMGLIELKQHLNHHREQDHAIVEKDEKQRQDLINQKISLLEKERKNTLKPNVGLGLPIERKPMESYNPVRGGFWEEGGKS